MDFDAGTLVVGIAASGAGYVLFTYGRRMGRPPHILLGLCLLIYPYFAPTALVSAAIGGGLLLLLWGAIKLGY